MCVFICTHIFSYLASSNLIVLQVLINKVADYPGSYNNKKAYLNELLNDNCINDVNIVLLHRLLSVILDEICKILEDEALDEVHKIMYIEVMEELFGPSICLDYKFEIKHFKDIQLLSDFAPLLNNAFSLIDPSLKNKRVWTALQDLKNLIGSGQECILLFNKKSVVFVNQLNRLYKILSPARGEEELIFRIDL